MKILHALVLLAALGVAGCGVPPSRRMNLLSVGMTTQEVVSIMGQADSTAASGHTIKVLRYRLSDAYGVPHDYFVKIVNGEVDSYGRMGDFDSTKDPTLNVNIKKD